jgi:class 3 adenylate cyclase
VGKTFGAGAQFNTRIGINSGLVVGGLVGSGDRVGYTVHGDNVNLTARLEQLNKDYGTRIIISENTYNLIDPNEYEFRGLGDVLVRGKKESIGIYTIDA